MIVEQTLTPRRDRDRALKNLKVIDADGACGSRTGHQPDPRRTAPANPPRRRGAEGVIPVHWMAVGFGSAALPYDARRSQQPSASKPVCARAPPGRCAACLPPSKAYEAPYRHEQAADHRGKTFCRGGLARSWSGFTRKGLFRDPGTTCSRPPNGSPARAGGATTEFEVKQGKWSFAHLPVIRRISRSIPLKETEDRLKLYPPDQAQGCPLA